MKNIIYTSSAKEGMRLILPVAIFELISTHAKSALPNEGGGVLVGWYSSDQKTAHVSQALMSAVDLGSRANFKRDGKVVTKRLQTIWKESSGREYCLGDWHSHPHSNPMPSSVDNATMYQMSQTKEEQLVTPLLVIIGHTMERPDSDVSVHAYPAAKCIKLRYTKTD